MQCSRSHPKINAQGAQKSRFVRLHKGKLFTTWRGVGNLPPSHLNVFIYAAMHVPKILNIFALLHSKKQNLKWKF